GAQQRENGGDLWIARGIGLRLGFRRGARNGLAEAHARALEERFLGDEEEQLVLFDRAAYRSAELVHPQSRLAILVEQVEEISRVQVAVSEVFEQAAVELIRSGLGDDRDLAAGTGSELGRIVAALDAKLLHVFEARLQAEIR